MSKIVILTGSPRPEGNTAALAKAFAEGAAQRHEVVTLPVAQMKIVPCRGCNSCFHNGNHCVQQDEMARVYAELAEAEVLVIASPVYFYGISAQLSAVINRLHNPVRDTFPIKRAVLLLASASRKPHVCEAIRLQYTLLLQNFGIDNAGIIAAQGVNAPGDILATEYLSQARQLGAGI